MYMYKSLKITDDPHQITEILNNCISLRLHLIIGPTHV